MVDHNVPNYLVAMWSGDRNIGCTRDTFLAFDQLQHLMELQPLGRTGAIRSLHGPPCLPIDDGGASTTWQPSGYRCNGSDCHRSFRPFPHSGRLVPAQVVAGADAGLLCEVRLLPARIDQSPMPGMRHGFRIS